MPYLGPARRPKAGAIKAKPPIGKLYGADPSLARLEFIKLLVVAEYAFVVE
jgi:hypothetical protein